MPRARPLFAVAAVAVTVLTACGTTNSDPDRPTVAVTTNILADVVGEIGGPDIEVLDLMPRGADPHSFELSADQAARIASADLVVTNGLGLEEGLATTLERLADEVPILEIGPHLDPIPYSHEVAASGPMLDPHVWTDPSRMVTATQLIADELGRLAPRAEPAIEERAASYVAELYVLDEWIASQVQAIEPAGRHLVTNHHVFGYFADRYDFVEIGAIIPSGTTLASPSAADLAELSDQVRDAGVSTIFAESSQPDRLAQALASEVGLEVEVVTLYTESLGPPGSGAATYLEMMRFNATAIVNGLS